MIIVSIPGEKRKGASVKIDLKDVLGHILWSGVRNVEDTYIINTQGIANGLYYITLTCEESIMQSSPVVVMQ
jgi:hypothetical protein